MIGVVSMGSTYDRGLYFIFINISYPKYRFIYLNIKNISIDLKNSMGSTYDRGRQYG